MPSDTGSLEPCPECHGEQSHKMDCSRPRARRISLAEGLANLHRAWGIGAPEALAPTSIRLTQRETDAIADGEPYCFRCGKPASSFPEYSPEGFEVPENYSHADYVRTEEGTYNRETNRFACDECYIAIGMPAGEPGDAYGWKAP